MKRKILLVEPEYKTKFPPLGLMKISSYHKELGDDVTFVKGMSKDAAYESWHRIYITTLFSYFWKITIETIRYYKYVVKEDLDRIYVGGVMATLMSDEVYRATGVLPHQGIIDKPNVLDENDLIVDEMIPDYKLFDNVEHNYQLLDSYIGYSTRGCIRKCKFCGVHLLEPQFIDYEGKLMFYLNGIRSNHGEKQHLVLLDNNILASRRFEQIISDLKHFGFSKEAKLNNRERRVDFNQGVDVRLLDDKKMRHLSSINIKPLRIAFDNISYHKQYENSVRLAAKHDIEELSNYILYNNLETPEDFWERLHINILLNEELGARIYSFPMKYIPITHKTREHTGPNWNWTFIRGVQRILNVTKGVVMPGTNFFYRAFGSSPEEFRTILIMPEHVLMNRGREEGVNERSWKQKYYSLTSNEKVELLEILNECKYPRNITKKYSQINNRKLKSLLDYYLTTDTDDRRFDLFDTNNSEE